MSIIIQNDLKLYYSKERRKYWFYTLLPTLLVLEIVIFIFIKNISNRDLIAVALLCTSSFLITGVLAILQMYSTYKFNTNVSKLTDLQRNEIARSANTCFKTGNLLITNDVILSYEMFSKKVILIEEVESVQMLDGKYEVPRYGVTVKGNIIQLKLKLGTYICIKGLALYTGEESKCICGIISKRLAGEELTEKDFIVFETYTINPPFHGIMLLVMTGALLFFSWLLPVLKYKMIQMSQSKNLLFQIGYAHIFSIALLIAFFMIFIAMFLIQKRVIRKDKAEWLSGNVYMIGIIFCFLILIGSVWSGTSETAKLARADYQSCKQGDYMVSNGIFYVSAGEVTRISWMNLDAVNAIQAYGMKLRYLYGENEIYILIDNNIKIDNDKKYGLKYLEHTRIVIDIKPL